MSVHDHVSLLQSQELLEVLAGDREPQEPGEPGVPPVVPVGGLACREEVLLPLVVGRQDRLHVPGHRHPGDAHELDLLQGKYILPCNVGSIWLEFAVLPPPGDADHVDVGVLETALWRGDLIGVVILGEELDKIAAKKKNCTLVRGLSHILTPVPTCCTCTPPSRPQTRSTAWPAWPCLRG